MADETDKALKAQEEFMETRPVKQEVVTQAGMCFLNTCKPGYDSGAPAAQRDAKWSPIPP